MLVRIIYGKLKPGSWDSYEQAYKEVMSSTGKIAGLRGRWLTRDVDNLDAGYSISVWKDEAAMRAYENSDVLKDTILPKLKPFFLGDYTTSRCEMRFLENFD
jgi:heme-degrading monooxygenase HmoA